MFGVRSLILLFVATSFIFRLLVIKNSEITFFSDDAIYTSFARFWREGDWDHVFHPFWPPLYPFFSSLTYRIVGNWEDSLRFVSALSASLLIIPVYLLAKNFLGLIPSIFVSFLSGFSSPIFGYSVLPLSDTLATLFVLSFLTTVVHAANAQKPRLFLVSGVAAGLFYLTRSEGLLFFYLGFLFICLYLGVQVIRKESLRKELLTIPFYVFVFLITISPYGVGVKNQLGHWSLGHKFSAQIQQGHAFELRNNTTWAQEVWAVRNPNYHSPYWRQGVKFVLENSNYLTSWFLEKLERWGKLFLSLFPIWATPFIILGIVNTLKRNLWGGLFLTLTILSLIPITIFSTASYEARYLLWTIPLIILFFTIGITRAAVILDRNPFLKTLLLSSLLFLPAFSLNIFNLPLQAREITQTQLRPEINSVGQWIKRNSQGATPKIMTRHEGFEFYAGGETIYLPETSKENVTKYAKERNVDYLVAWTRDLAGEGKLLDLSDPNSKNPGLERVFSTTSREGNIVVYTLKEGK